MSVIINTNLSAMGAAYNLSKSNAALQNSIAMLSSGSNLVSSSSNPGGLAVSMSLQATIAQTNAANETVSNANSFLQTQDGALSVVGDILTRMAELQTLAQDPTQSSSDIANYGLEFTALQSQLNSLEASTFNGVNLFSTTSGGSTISIPTSPGGTTTSTVHLGNLGTAISALTGSATVSSVSASTIQTAISNVAAERAQNGADSSNLNFASQFLSVNAQNLTAANSTIADVDVASASTDLAKNQILVQAGTSMLSQANAAAQYVLKLLQ